MTRTPRYGSQEVLRKHVDLYHTWMGLLLVGALGLGLTDGIAAPATVGPLVVLDPGHGGANLGAAGRLLREKQLTLAVALRLRGLLVDRGYRVVLTREDDRYLTLRERVRRSNAVDAALFISLHANASPDHTQEGIETYVLDRAVAAVEAQRQSRRAIAGAA